MPCHHHQCTPPTPLSWLQVEWRWVTIDPLNRVAITNGREFLAGFHRHVCNHHIPYWGASKKVLVLSNISRQIYSFTLNSLLALKNVPLIVQIPVPASQFNGGCHDRCYFCGDFNSLVSPFEIVLETKQGRGRPHRGSTLPANEYFSNY